MRHDLAVVCARPARAAAEPLACGERERVDVLWERRQRAPGRAAQRVERVALPLRGERRNGVAKEGEAGVVEGDVGGALDELSDAGDAEGDVELGGLAWAVVVDLPELGPEEEQAVTVSVVLFYPEAFLFDVLEEGKDGRGRIRPSWAKV